MALDFVIRFLFRAESRLRSLKRIVLARRKQGTAFTKQKGRDSYSLVGEADEETSEFFRSLQHFHFWCLQSDRTQRGFSSRKAALRCPVLFRVEVKMR